MNDMEPQHALPHGKAAAEINTVGDLRLWDASIDTNQLTIVAEQMLNSDPELPGVVVRHMGHLVALMSRKTLFGQLSRPLGRDIYLNRPVSEMLGTLERHPLTLPHEMSVAAAVENALSRPTALVYEPVLVRTPGQPHRILAVDLLLRVQSALLDSAIRAKDELLAEVQRTAAELRTTLVQFEQARDRLVQSEKMVALGQLVAGVAHEINTPIGVALTAATHLSERTQEFDKLVTEGQLRRSDLSAYTSVARQSTELLRFNIQRAAQLIQSFKQVAVDQASEQMRDFELSDYLEQLVTSLRPEARKLGHNLAVTCPEGIAMTAYPGALAQVLSNLISNALMHAYAPGTAGNLRVQVRDQGSTVAIMVEDDGAGIPAENLSRIYDPFFTTKRGSGGSGLGLHIVFNIVHETLKGEITCRSNQDEGTVFTVTLPRMVA